MLRRLYDWTLALAGHRRANWALFGVSFAESSFFPIPPDALLLPMIFANPAKAFRLAAVCTLASVLGGIFGYLIGYYLFDLIGRPLLEFYGYADKFESFQDRYNEQGVWIVLFAGLTPFPYKVITIASGVTHLNFIVFMAASVVARGARFFIVAALLWKFGPPIREFVERWLGPLFVLFMVLLIGGFYLVKFLM